MLLLAVRRQSPLAKEEEPGNVLKFGSSKQLVLSRSNESSSTEDERSWNAVLLDVKAREETEEEERDRVDSSIQNKQN